MEFWGILLILAHCGYYLTKLRQNTCNILQNGILKESEMLDVYGGASLLQNKGMVIRVLGHSSQTLQKIMKTCWDYFRQELFHLQPLELHPLIACTMKEAKRDVPFASFLFL